MFALISPNEKTSAYQRIAEVAEQPFPVAAPLHWIEVSASVTAEGYGYDPVTRSAVVVYTPEQEQP